MVPIAPHPLWFPTMFRHFFHGPCKLLPLQCSLYSVTRSSAVNQYSIFNSPSLSNPTSVAVFSSWLSYFGATSPVLLYMFPYPVLLIQCYHLTSGPSTVLPPSPQWSLYSVTTSALGRVWARCCCSSSTLCVVSYSLWCVCCDTHRQTNRRSGGWGV